MSAAVIVFVVCAVACAVANIAILFSTLGRPAGTDVGAAGVPRPQRAAEIAWALLPVLALALVLTATWGRVRERERDHPRPREVMKVAR